MASVLSGSLRSEGLGISPKGHDCAERVRAADLPADIKVGHVLGVEIYVTNLERASAIALSRSAAACW